MPLEEVLVIELEAGQGIEQIIEKVQEKSSELSSKINSLISINSRHGQIDESVRRLRLDQEELSTYLTFTVPGWQREESRIILFIKASLEKIRPDLIAAGWKPETGYSQVPF